MTKTSKHVFFLLGRFWRTLHGNVAAMTVAPDGRTLAVALPDDSLRLLETDRGKEVRLFASPHSQATALAFSPDGKTLAAATGDNWRSASGTWPPVGSSTP